MKEFALHFLDYFFLVFHTFFIIFNLSGWVFPGIRKIHFITMLSTFLSWFILGIWYGWGFCFCTDWHWKVRDILGDPIKSDSYIHFLILEISGIDLNPALVDHTVLAVTVACFVLSCVMNLLDLRKGDSAIFFISVI